MKREGIFNSTSKCSLCGKRFVVTHKVDGKCNLDDMHTTRQLCYECAYWTALIEAPPDDLEVLGDRCIRIMPLVLNADKSMLLGNKGKTRYFLKEDFTVLISNDIWIIGKIPERFKEKLPPTVIEIDKRYSHRLMTNKRRCKARACMDRYNCLRYDLDIEKTNKPFNAIPAKWKPGDEHCGFFINLLNLKPKNPL